MKSEDKKRRRLDFVTTQCYYVTKENLSEYKSSKFVPKKILKFCKEAHKLFDELGIDEEQRKKIWITARRRTYKSFRNPKPPRKDNKTYINYGSGSPGHSDIRYPKKKRKTAWKRFFKLFPRLRKLTNKLSSS